LDTISVSKAIAGKLSLIEETTIQEQKSAVRPNGKTVSPHPSPPSRNGRALTVVQQSALNNTEKRTSISASRLFKTLLSVSPKTKAKAVVTSELVPELSLSRRQASLSEHAFSNENDLSVVREQNKTVLYLAYGSNLCYETFQGRRGIKPLAQLNVVVPELRMTFDLPGVPYSEPCFANSARRDTNVAGQHTKEKQLGSEYHKDRWKKGMVGVVYEVTPSDYAHIIATEGGGSAYQDILVTCYPVSSEDEVPLEPKVGAFKSHTLFAPPVLPPTPGQPTNGRFQRPDPSYAQASARYLKLITDGAEEHNIPKEYKDYLYSLRPYTITTQGQRLGQFVLTAFWTPFILLVFALNGIFRDDKGRAPKWLVMLSNAIFSSVWTSYDDIFKPIFGDGERTLKDGGGEDEGMESKSLLKRIIKRKDEEWAGDEKLAGL
jgi:hypothetical protein